MTHHPRSPTSPNGSRTSETGAPAPRRPILTAVLLLVLALAVVPDYSFAQSPVGAPPPDLAQDSEHVVSFPYYSLREPWDTVLALNNAVDRTLTVSLAAYSLDGSFLALPDQHLPPQQNLLLSLGTLLPRSKKFKEGSLELRFRGGPMDLGPQLTVSDSRDGLSFDMEPLMGPRSSHLEGLWWSLDDEMAGRVILSNTTTEPLSVQVAVDWKSARRRARSVLLPPHGTRVIEIGRLLKTLHLSEKGIGRGGISLQHDGAPGALTAHGFVFSQRQGFASNLNFVDPHAQASAVLNSTGMPLAHPPAFPEGTLFRPLLFLRNTAARATTAKVEVQYTAAGRLATKVLPLTRLPPHAVSLLDLSGLARSLEGQLIEDAGVRVETSGGPGSVVGQLVSLGSQGLTVDCPLVSVHPKKPRSGAHPFQLGGGYTSILHLKNTGTKNTEAIVKLLHEGGDFALDLIRLLPGQSVAIDLQELRDARKLDIHGHALPSNLETGQAVWSQHGDQPILGRLVRFSPSGMATNFSCGGPCSCPAVYLSSEMSPSGIDGEAGDTTGPLAVYEYDYYEACPGFAGVIEGPFTVDARFTSDDPSVAAVDEYGSQVALNDGGETTIRATFSTAVHNDRFSDCAEGGCETVCTPIMDTLGETMAVVVRPKITSIVPSRGVIGATTAVTINGRGFRTGATVSAGTGVAATVSSVSSTKVNADFAVAADAPLGDHDVTVKVRTKPSNSVRFFVQTPTSLAVLSSGVSPDRYPNPLPNGCPTSSPFGMQSLVNYRVLDQGGEPIKSTLTLRENLRDNKVDGQTAAPDLLDVPVTASGATEADGTFQDNGVGGCATGAFGTGQMKQELFIKITDSIKPIIRTNNWSFTGKNGCGTMQNGTDVTVAVSCP